MNKLFLNTLLILIAVAVPSASAQGPGGVEGAAAWFRTEAVAGDSLLVPAVPAAIGYYGPSAVPGYSAGLDVGSYNTNSIKIHTVHSVSHTVHGIWGTGDDRL